MDLIPLTSIEQFDELILESVQEDTVFLIFKHSTRCLVSKMALNSFASAYDRSYPVYFLDLIKYRNLSNHIERQTGVHHQSPQLIVIKGGKSVYHASHYSIQADLVRALSL